jgi:hypothetical protein
MAVLRNIAGDARDIPLAGRIVEDGEDFEVDDLEFWQHSFSEELFKVVDPPAIPDPNAKAAQPAKNAKTEDWAAYAVEHRGATPEDVEGKTRDELIDTYGQE